MRIVQIVDSLDMGGMERMAIDLAVQQKCHGHQMSFYTMFHTGTLAVQAEDAGIPVRSFGKQPGLSPRILWALTRALVNDNPDVVHTHNAGIHHYAALAARLAGVPVVVNTRHGCLSSDGRPYREQYFRCGLPFTDRVVFVSEDSLEQLVPVLNLPVARSTIIRNGIPVHAFRSCLASPGSLRPRIRFGTIGRMVPAKAHQILIRAFREVSRQLPDAELRVVGGGPLLEELRLLVANFNLAGRIHIEPVSRNVPDVLAKFDVFVLSSLNEGLPLAVLEAMAAGLPIVSTRVGGVPEVAPEGRFAWYCAPGNVEQLASVMLQAATSPDLASRGAAASDHALRHFDISTMYKEYDSLYEQLLLANAQQKNGKRRSSQSKRLPALTNESRR